jgi:hypothetical protein
MLLGVVSPLYPHAGDETQGFKHAGGPSPLFSGERKGLRLKPSEVLNSII